MYALKKELALMSEAHIAEFVGFSRSGKWVVYQRRAGDNKSGFA